MESKDIIILSVLLAVMLAVLAVAVLQQRKEKAKLTALLPHFPGRISSGLLSNYLEFMDGDRLARIQLIPKTKNSPPQLAVKVRQLDSLKMHIVKRGTILTWLRGRGWMKGCETGDPLFDQHCFVSGRDKLRAGMLLQDPARRETIRLLIDDGFDPITWDGKWISAVKLNYSDTDLSPDRLRARLDGLKSLV